MPKHLFLKSAFIISLLLSVYFLYEYYSFSYRAFDRLIDSQFDIPAERYLEEGSYVIMQEVDSASAEVNELPEMFSCVRNDSVLIADTPFQNCPPVKRFGIAISSEYKSVSDDEFGQKKYPDSIELMMKELNNNFLEFNNDTNNVENDSFPTRTNPLGAVGPTVTFALEFEKGEKYYKNCGMFSIHESKNYVIEAGSDTNTLSCVTYDMFDSESVGKVIYSMFIGILCAIISSVLGTVLLVKAIRNKRRVKSLDL